ncbi:DNA polymerase III subunit beta [Buchnera aphidicola]|uniref:Beta sliding clamp n=1 Tax=Buchnera aphidicola (Stegophylla sp.) TaxID=2315800 RepID=A0A4D6YMF2_9GAMM|nr:DNA polymerase III subunit beta [Buchnera aphidicola (Stegophylla sp.)]QCI26215.1 DNA polymerase III subunit beta [Buchnera aphidicola (Stegophylla sp.)]
MNLIIKRNNILKPLQKLNSLISVNHENININNVLFKFKKDCLFLISTNLEIELIVQIFCIKICKFESISVCSKKILHIVRSFPIDSEICFIICNKNMKIICKNIYFLLSVLPGKNFPKFKKKKFKNSIIISQKKFKDIIYNTQFSMAKQDVRHYLNGMYFEINQNKMFLVSTDGYRISVSSILIHDISPSLYYSIIIPRKTIMELTKLLNDINITLSINIGSGIIQFYINEYILSSKLIDNNFPDYKSLLIKNFDTKIQINRMELKQSLNRASILTHNKFPGVTLQISSEKCIVIACNEQDEQVKEELLINYFGPRIELTMNIHYILEVINVVKNDFITILLNHSMSGIYIKDNQEFYSIYIIMPLIL